MIRVEDLPTVSSDKKGWPWNVSSEVTHSANLPKISIITPTLNQGEYIEETIRSVLLQNYPNYELIIIDGGSNDETLEIIKKYDHWITKWISEPDNGQSHAINKGLSLITGEIFNWLNSDDILTINALYRIGQTFKDNNSVQCIRGNILSYDDRSSKVSSSRFSYDDGENIGFALTRILQPATFFKTELLDNSNIGTFNETLHYIFDLEWMIRFLIRIGGQNIVQIDDILSHFRLHPESKTVSQLYKFHEETVKFFIYLANQSNNRDMAKILNDIFRIDYHSSKIQFQQIKIDSDLACSALHNYLLYKSDEQYWLKKYDNFKRIYKAIKPEYLNSLGKSKYKKLQLRSLLPSLLLDIVR